jgi:hypothetical protein
MAKSFPNTGATVGLAADRSALTSPFAGMQFFETDTNVLYVYNGSAWVALASAAAPTALQLISPTSVVNATNSNSKIIFSAQSSFSINGCFSSAFDNYRIIISEFVGTIATCADLQLKLRVAGADASSGYAFSYLFSNNTTSGRTYNTGQIFMATVIVSRSTNVWI